MAAPTGNTPRDIRPAPATWSVAETDWQSIVPADTLAFVSACADGLGASKEAFFFPLLSAVAAVLGRNATISVNEFWPEPPIVWTAIIADDRCRKKSAIQRFIVTSMKEAMKYVTTEHAQQIFLTGDPDHVVSSSVPTVSLMCDPEFDVEEIATRCKDGAFECFLFSRELGRIYRTFEADNDVEVAGDAMAYRSRINQECFFDLQNTGISPWPDEVGSVSSDARFNLTGFVHLEEAIRMVNNSATSRRFLESTLAVVAVKRGKAFLSSTRPGAEPDRLLLAPVLFKLRQEHGTTRVYTLDERAHSAFASYYNDIEKTLDQVTNMDTSMWRVLSKSQGHVLRLALILHCLDHVIRCVRSEQASVIQKFENQEVIPGRISAATMLNAISLMKMCIQHKGELIKSAAASAQAATAKSQSSESNNAPGQQPAATEQTDQKSSTSIFSPAKVPIPNSPSPINVTLQMSSENRPTIVPVSAQRRYSDLLPVVPQLSVAAPRPPQPAVITVVSQDTLQPVAPMQRLSVPLIPIKTNELVPSQTQQGPIPVNLKQGPVPVNLKQAPVPVNVKPAAPIVQGSSPIQGSINTQRNTTPQTSTYNSIDPMDQIQTIDSGTVASALPVVHTLPRPKSSMDVHPRSLSRVTSTAAKVFARKTLKKRLAPAHPTEITVPPCHDYQNFMEFCPSKARRILTLGLNSVEAVWVAQRKLIKPVIDPTTPGTGRRSQKYPTNAARALLSALADAGLGDMISRTGGRSGKSTFRKRKYQDLSPSALDVLRRLNISKQQFSYAKTYIFNS